jgi:hypothetical protein
MMPRRRATLTSPGNPGVFLFPSSAPFNRPAYAPPLPRAGGLPSALPLCPVRPLPPRLGQADKPRRPVRATAARAACDPVRRPSAALSLCRCFPCPVPPVSRAALGKPCPAALAPPGEARQPLAAGRCRRSTPPPVARPVRRPSAGDPCRRRRRKEWRFTNPR